MKLKPTPFPKSFVKLLLLGTRWCGYGSELGLDYDKTTTERNNSTLPTVLPAIKSSTESSPTNTAPVDFCCKVHDHCEHYIPRWKTKYHLVNWRPFTISSCECDSKFLKCLQKDDSLSAKDIRRIYFDILEVPCFKLDLKDVKICAERTWFMACKKFSMRSELHAVLSSITSDAKESTTFKEKN